MTDKFLTPLPLTVIKTQLAQNTKDKIEKLEERLLGPNTDGKLPTSGSQPLEQEDAAEINNKIISSIIQQQSISIDYEKDDSEKNKSPVKNASKSSVKRYTGDEKIEKYLLKKRYNPESFENYNEKYEKKDKNSRTNLGDNLRHENNSDSCKSDKNEITGDFSSKNLTNQNHLFNYKINDYLNSTASAKNNNSPISINSNDNNKYQTPKNKNNYNIPNNNKFKSGTSQTNSNNNNNNNNKSPTNGVLNTDQNFEMILKKLTEKNNIIEEKEKELNKLRADLLEKDNIIQSLQNYNKDSENEIKRCRFDISNMVKEIGEFERRTKKRWIHDQEYQIGHLGFQRYGQGHIMDYWEDGEKFIKVKWDMENNKIKKEEIEKQKRKLATNFRNKSKNFGKENNNKDNNNSPDFNETFDQDQELRDLLNFKSLQLQKKDVELKEQKAKLEIEKSILIHESNLYHQELHCSFAQKKEGWPLLAGRYQIVGLLGKGGYSEVYKAYDLENHIYVAVKLHQLNQNWKEEIKDNYIKHTIRENQIHKEINFCKIVKHYDTIEIDNNSFCTVLEYCTGPDLGAYLQRNKSIPEKEAKIIITQILEGLEYLNKLPKKIIHYDLKPENIIFHDMEVKISDFGLAKVIESNNDRVQLTSQGVGTYWYLPPECFEENPKIDISSKVDIWSCGVILYEMFFKKKPFGNNFTQDKLIKERIMTNARNVEFPAKPVISDECKDFIKKCLAYRQDERIDVFQALEHPFIRQEKYKNAKKGFINNNLMKTNHGYSGISIDGEFSVNGGNFEQGSYSTEGIFGKYGYDL